MAAPLYNKNHFKHGLSHTRIDNIYKAMVDRCCNPKSYNYKKYGLKGITVCKEWKENKIRFFEWAFKHGYADNLTLDRIDNNKGYSPNNCRWATYREQNNNRKSNKRIALFGEEKTVADWSRIKGISQGTIYARLKRGWSIEKTLNTPIAKTHYEQV